jgi:hypothetical protein
VEIKIKWIKRKQMTHENTNQQKCFIYSTASFLSKLRAKKVEKLHNSSFYRNFLKLKEIKFFFIPPFFISTATAAKFVLPIPIFLAYLVPLDVDVMGNITAKICEVWSEFNINSSYYYSSPFFLCDMNVSTADLRNYWTEFHETWWSYLYMFLVGPKVFSFVV